jgi:serine/threonine-protein kinase
VLDDQQQRWENGQPRPVQHYLDEHPDLAANPEFALQLVYGEICLRRARGDSFDAGDYLDRFPHLRQALERQLFVDSWACESTVIVPPKAPTPAPAPAPHRFPASLDLSDYELGMLLSTERGSMGAVYQARQLSLGRLVAVKFLKPGKGSPEAIERFREEARAAAQLTHPHIVRIHGVGHSPDRGDFLVMEFIDGVNLEDRLAVGPLDLKRAAEIVADVADAIEHAHARNVIHRDLKPGNILINADDQVMVTDFGLAKRLDWSQLEKEPSNLIFGTPGYMAPEQVDAKCWGPVGRRTDVYGLGGLLHACLTGKPPFQGRVVLDVLRQVASPEAAPPVRTHRRDVPEALETICTRCLAKDPAHRYSSAASVAAALRAWSAAPQSVAPQTPAPAPNQDQARPRAAVLAIPGVAIVLLLIGLVTVTWFSPQPGPSAPVKILALDVFRWQADPGKPVSLTQIPGPLTTRDRITIECRLSRPAYPYLYWIDSAGQVFLRYPESGTAPVKVQEFRWPSVRIGPDRGIGWRLGDGTGTVVAVLIVVDRSLSDSDLAAAQQALRPAGRVPGLPRDVVLVNGLPVERSRSVGVGEGEAPLVHPEINEKLDHIRDYLRKKPWVVEAEVVALPLVAEP